MRKRDQSIIVVVADVADLWALERAHAVNGRYHVLGGTLSPLDGVGPQDLTIDALISRAHEPQVKELILALNATVDGQTTAHYITELLQDANVKVTRLAHGVPVGGELDYLDEGTLVGGDQAADVVLIVDAGFILKGEGWGGVASARMSPADRLRSTPLSGEVRSASPSSAPAA